MELSQAIRARRSVRKFLDKPVPDALIEQMLEAARAAPSGGNAQTHVFGVVRDPDIKRALAQAAGNQMWIATAPVVFACCADISWDIADAPEGDFALCVNWLRFGREFIDYLNRYPDAKSRMTLFANAAPLIPAEHICLTAAAHGLGTCFIGYLDVARANRILRLPDHITCLFLLPTGYPDEVPAQRNVKPLDELVFWDHWQAPSPTA